MTLQLARIGGSVFGGPPLWFQIGFYGVFILVAMVFLFVIGSAIFTAVRNRSQPELVRDAMVVSKRTHIWGRSGTSYYVTFEFPDGNREELQVAPSEFGLLAEGDVGTLRSQGSWFKGFNRGQNVV